MCNKSFQLKFYGGVYFTVIKPVGATAMLYYYNRRLK